MLHYNGNFRRFIRTQRKVIFKTLKNKLRIMFTYVCQEHLLTLESQSNGQTLLMVKTELEREIRFLNNCLSSVKFIFKPE